MSRIHDALRRAEEALGRNGNHAGRSSDDADQILEILEVLRVTEEMPLSTEAEAGQDIARPPHFELVREPARNAQTAPIAEPPPAIPGSNGNGAVPDAILSAARAASEGGHVVELSRVQSERELGHEPTPIAASRTPNTPITFEELISRCRTKEWKPDAEQMLSFDLRAPNTFGLEEFRTLRARLYHIRQQKALKTLLITSALPAEGKTFVSSNLAQTLARQRGRRVLLVDCDLRRSRLHERLGTDATPGLSDYLRGDVDVFAIVQRGAMENLAFIPGGRQTSNPAELLGNGRLDQLLRRLGTAFDWIVIDSPPAVPVSDASVIARFCDGILMVVRAAQTPFDLAQRARNEFRNTPLLGVVLNGVEAGSTYVSYYYGAYGEPSQEAAGGAAAGAILTGDKEKS